MNARAKKLEQRRDKWYDRAMAAEQRANEAEYERDEARAEVDGLRVKLARVAAIADNLGHYPACLAEETGHDPHCNCGAYPLRLALRAPDPSPDTTHG